MKNWFKKIMYNREYPFVTEHGIRYGIHGAGVLHVDVSTIIASEDVQRQVRACKDIKLV